MSNERQAPPFPSMHVRRFFHLNSSCRYSAIPPKKAYGTLFGRLTLRVGSRNGLDPLADLLRELDDDSLREARARKFSRPR
jgi:hypothetical protein